MKTNSYACKRVIFRSALLLLLSLKMAICFAATESKLLDQEHTPLISGQRRAPDRISHWHSGDLQTKAETAANRMKAFGDEASGLEAAMLNNLGAQVKLRDTLIELQNSIDEEHIANSILALDWRSFATAYYTNTGLADLPGKDLDELMTVHGAVLKSRLSLLSTLSSGYNLLALQTEVQSQATKSAIAADSAKLTNSTPSSPVTNKSDFLNLVMNLGTNLLQAARLSYTNAQTLTNINSEIKTLYELFKASHDDEPLMMVVPIIGSDLSSASYQALTNQVINLRSQIWAFYTTNFCARTNAAPSNEKEKGQNSRLRSECEKILKPVTHTNYCSQPAVWLTQEELIATNLPAIYHNNKNWAARSAPGAKSASFQLKAFSETLKNKSLQIDTDSREERLHLATNLSALSFSISALQDESAELSGAIDKALRLSAPAETPASNVIVMLTPLDKKGIVPKSTNPQKESQSQTNSSADLPGFQQIIDMLFDGKLGNEKKPLISSNYVAGFSVVTNLLGDILKQSSAEGERLKAFIGELYSIRGQLQKENARHYQSLNAILAREIRRWLTMGMLHENYSRELSRGTRSGVLFDPSAQPAVRQDDPILFTLRQISDTARRAQNKPAVDLNDHKALVAAHQRMRAAVALVQGYFLLNVYSYHYAREDRKRLLAELQEHKIHLHSLETRINRSEISLALADQLAFHSTGWTQEDVANILRAIQAGFVGWVGSK